MAIALLVIACNPAKNTKIAGIYVMAYKNQYSMATDTIVIKAYNESADTYEVERRDGYHRIRDGKILPKEWRQEKWMATFDQDKMLLAEGEFGRKIYLKGDGRSLEYNSTYKRIK